MILAYFVGAIPSGLWLGKTFKGVDLREYGSGNMGATNAFRVLGKPLGVIVLLADVLKGILPVALLPRLLGFDPATPVEEFLIGGSAVVGHVLSVFVNFRGGKGVATALGVFLAIVPGEMLVILGIAIGIIVITGYVSLAAVVAACLLPVALFITGQPWIALLITCIISILVIVRHRSNIMRLMVGKENRLTDPVPMNDAGPQASTAASESHGYTPDSDLH